MAFEKSVCAIRITVAVACLFAAPVAGAQEASTEKRLDRGANVETTARRLTAADFKQANPGAQARSLADWVVESGDANRTPFLIVDKKDARVFVFDGEGHLRGEAPALLGIAIGDHTAPGVGDRELSTIPLKDRTTPAGRFQVEIGRNDKGKEILWVDYEAAISMHPVIDTPKQRRPQRLASPTVSDNRISFGCINVPIPFFSNVVARTFTGTKGVAYVLPEVRTIASVFKAYAAERPADARLDSKPAAQPVRANR